MSLLQEIIKHSSLKEPYAGGDQDFAEQIRASLPFLKIIPKTKRKILVVGCGEGYEIKWLADHGFLAMGITNSQKEAVGGSRRHGVSIEVADMHCLPFADKSFDCVYAANILEHSVAPFVALREWRRILGKKGWLVVVMPSKEWIAEYYHFSVLTHSQVKDLLAKSGFRLLAGPEKEPLVDLRGGDVFYDLGRGWGHYDGYVAQKTGLPKKKFMLGKNNHHRQVSAKLWPLQLIKSILKHPYNFIRVWHARNSRE